MMKKVRIFVAFTPFHLVTASATASLLDSPKILVWFGKEFQEDWHILIDKFEWCNFYDLSNGAFWGPFISTYYKCGRFIKPIIQSFVKKELSSLEIEELLIPSDECVSINVLFKILGADWDKLSLYEDGTGIYLTKRKQNALKYSIKMLLDSFFFNIYPKTLKIFSGNDNIKRIYTVFPKLVCVKRDKEIISINHTFFEKVNFIAKKLDQISPLPNGSAVILTSGLSESGLFRLEDELHLYKGMISFLKRIGAKEIFVKFHHYELPNKKRFLLNFGIKEIRCPQLPYEILHIRLKPYYLMSFASASLLYCSYLSKDGIIFAFAGSEKMRVRFSRAFKLFSQAGVSII